MAKTLYTSNAHVHFFKYGFTVKHRKEEIWTWHQFIFWKRNTNRDARRKRDRELGKRKAIIVTRPTVTPFEYSMWRTRNNKEKKWENERVKSTKAYVRLKICAGGRIVERKDRHPGVALGRVTAQTPVRETTASRRRLD